MSNNNMSADIMKMPFFHSRNVSTLLMWMVRLYAASTAVLVY